MADGGRIEGKNRLGLRALGFAKMLLGTILWQIGGALEASEDVFLVDSLAQLVGALVSVHGASEFVTGKRHTLMPQPVR